MIVTARLDLVPATLELLRAALDAPSVLASGLDAVVPPTWPPEFLDEPSLRYLADRLEEAPGEEDWWLHFVVLARGGVRERTVIGSAGYKGPPTADGTVEVGYGIVRDQQRRGHASEAVRGLLARAFALPSVTRAIAETLPELAGSRGVLRACGFRLVGEGSEPGVLRFELPRARYREAEPRLTP